MAVACQKEDYPPEPQLEFIDLSKFEVKQNGLDSITFDLRFTDGDGNFGSESQDNVFLTDTRTGLQSRSFRIAPLEDGSGGVREGNFRLSVRSECCIYPDTTDCIFNLNYPKDTMSYRIQIEDAVGNRSNVVETPKFRLDCL